MRIPHLRDGERLQAHGRLLRTPGFEHAHEGFAEHQSAHGEAPQRGEQRRGVSALDEMGEGAVDATPRELNTVVQWMERCVMDGAALSTATTSSERSLSWRCREVSVASDRWRRDSNDDIIWLVCQGRPHKFRCCRAGRVSSSSSDAPSARVRLRRQRMSGWIKAPFRLCKVQPTMFGARVRTCTEGLPAITWAALPV
jgi:hypothetical protein